MTARAKDCGNHRLIDIVVEEVSLADRAANLHRFLIVKRSDAMTDDSETTAETPVAALEAAIEELAAAVGELEGEELSPEVLSSLVARARASIDALAALTGNAAADSASKSGADPLSEVKDSLGELRQLLEARKGDGEQLRSLGADLRTLTGAVKDQGQRIAQLEKRAGLPASLPAEGRTAKADAAEDTSWPLDLNRPADRDAVDKSVSFHDIDR